MQSPFSTFSQANEKVKEEMSSESSTRSHSMHREVYVEVCIC